LLSNLPNKRSARSAVPPQEIDGKADRAAAKEIAREANWRIQQGDLTGAREVLESASKDHSRNPAVLRVRGELEFQSGNYAASAAQWRILLKKKKRNGQADAQTYTRLAVSMRKSGDIDGALAVLERAVKSHPEDRAVSDEISLLQRLIDERDADALQPQKPSSAGSNPYKGRPDHNFWKRSVSNRNPLEIDTWYRKKFSLTGQSIACAGSCFAQHLGRRLKRSGFDFVDAEPAPEFLREESHTDFGYGMYSARYGNIYTTRQLLQLVQRAFGQFKPVEMSLAHKGGVVDPFRPTIEPEPFGSEAEMLRSQRDHLAAVLDMLRRLDVFVFTLGLTECWVNEEDGSAYPIAPGVSGGTYDPRKHSLRNFGYMDVKSDLNEFVRLVKDINPRLKMLMTVSPVPLMATATEENVVVATTYSKSVLRAVAGEIACENDWADYFPSFEIISSHVMRGRFYDADLRTVSEHGVDHVMKQFFAQHRPLESIAVQEATEPEQDIICDEELIEAFGL
jgi:tetratricopeptide (TPR) repeat protein